jgi:uncharacterized repeat protein (TIGR03803 family)
MALLNEPSLMRREFLPASRQIWPCVAGLRIKAAKTEDERDTRQIPTGEASRNAPSAPRFEKETLHQLRRKGPGRVHRAAFLLTVLTLVWASFMQAQVETVLFNFNSIDETTGFQPQTGLVLDQSGNLYGTTLYGGDLSCDNGNGCGVVYEISPQGDTWTGTAIYTFTGAVNASMPGSSLIFDKAGNLYGSAGGGKYGWGSVFELSRQGNGWVENVLYDFKGGKDGEYPGSLILDDAGNIYGMTVQGGNTACRVQGFYGCGVVFELSPSAGGSWSEKVLYTFSKPSEGAYPQGLTFDSSGNLFGVTEL